MRTSEADGGRQVEARHELAIDPEERRGAFHDQIEGVHAPGSRVERGHDARLLDAVREVAVGPEPAGIDGDLLDRGRLRVLVEGEAVVPGRLGLLRGVDEGDGRREVRGGDARRDGPEHVLRLMRACLRRVRRGRVLESRAARAAANRAASSWQPPLWASRPVGRLLRPPTPGSRCRRSPGPRRCSPRRSRWSRRRPRRSAPADRSWPAVRR